MSVINFPAQELYRRNGFEVKEWVPRYYIDENEDALEMVCKFNKDDKDTCIVN